MQVALAFIALLTVVTSLSLGVSDRLEQLVITKRENEYKRVLMEFAAGIERFAAVNYRYPTSLGELTGSAGFEHLSSLLDTRIGYSVAEFTGNGFTYQKAVVWHKRNNRFLDDADVLENNQIGATNFDEDGDYQPPADVYWYIENSLNLISYTKQQVLFGLDETAQRLVYGNNRLPIDSATGELAVGDVVTLADAVGYAGSAVSCSGVFTFDGAPLTCSDLFYTDGTPVTYQLLSDVQAAIVVESANIKAEDGTPVLLFTDLTVDAN